MTYDEFIARAKEASPRKGFDKELRSLYVDGGTLQVLVLMMLQQKEAMLETLAATHMVNQEAIYRGIGQQGQVLGVDIILHSIFEAMTEKDNEPTDEVSAVERGAAP